MTRESPVIMHTLQPNVPQFLFDNALIAHQGRLTRRWLPATVFPEPVVKPDKPWERVLGYLSVLAHPEDGYRMYYWKFDPRRFGTNARGSQSMVCLATSRDGFHWEKPNLGLVEWEGSRENNILIASEWHCDGHSVVLETIPLTWPGGELLLNADARDGFDRHPLPHQFGGQIEIEVLGTDGQPLPDWSGDNRSIWRGNTHCRMHKDIGALVTWPRDRKLDTLRGQAIRLRFCLKHARLFTFAAQASMGGVRAEV